MPGKCAQGQSDQQASDESAQVAHIVNVAEDAAAEIRETQDEIQYGKTDGAAEDGAFLPSGNIQVAKFHSGHDRADNAKDSPRSAKLRLIRIGSNAQQRSAYACDHVNHEGLPFSE